MAMNNADPRNELAGNGVLTTFTYTFRIFQAADLVVFVNSVQKVQDVDYTVTGVDSLTGGTVVFTVAPANGAPLIFTRATTQTRDDEFNQDAPWSSKVTNKSFDKQIAILQDLTKTLSRVFRIGLTVTGVTDASVPAPLGDQLIGWRSDATKLVNITRIAAGGVLPSTPTTSGITRYATLAEVAAGTATDAAVTASGLGVNGAASSVVRLDSSSKLPAVNGSALIGTGGLLAIQYLTTSGNYTKNAAASYIVVEVVAGGGGSGGLGATSAGQACASAGGGGGGYSRKKILNSALAATTAYVVGAAGTAGAAGVNTGGTGGTSTFSTLSATGGAGGVGGLGVSATAIVIGIAAGGIGSGGDLNLPGGGASVAFIISGAGSVSGSGGSSYLAAGSSGQSVSTATALPVAGAGPGAGASGGTQSSSLGSKAGAVGGAGLIIVYEYA